MPVFDQTRLFEIRNRAEKAGLAMQRDRLTYGLQEFIKDALPGWNARNPLSGLSADLAQLNNWDEPVGGEIPFVIWLSNATSVCAPLPSSANFFDEMAQLAVQVTPPPTILPVPGGNEITTPERILFKTALLPHSYFALATLRANAVARLSVFQFENGQQKRNPDGSKAGAYGTGWLIGKKHLITNWHVVHARPEGTPPPPMADINKQVDTAHIEFDYCSEGQMLASVSGTFKCHNPDLDFAIIELDEEEDREPLPLLGTSLEIDEDDVIAANIIQHPAGGPRQYGVRNNLVATVKNDDLAYFTDTRGGSSGAPVCDDNWNVIALHKASTLRFGNLNFQGKSTAWINTGTLIAKIIKDLSENQEDLWEDIKAKVV